MKESKINVILYGNLIKMDFYETGLKDFKNIKIISKTDNFEKLEELNKNFKKT